MNTNEGSTQPGEGQVTGNETTALPDLAKELAALKATNARLLEESKGAKEAKRKIEAELSKQQEEIATKNNDLAKLLEMRTSEVNEYKTKAMKLEEAILTQRAQSVVAEFAKDAISLEDILNQPVILSSLKDAIDRETLTVDEDRVKQSVESLKKAKAHLFKVSSQPGVVTRKPGTQSAPQMKALEDMKVEEIEAALRAGRFQ
jgi:hypothetical protein